jgi:putative peptidoglycan lipid II flippase
MAAAATPAARVLALRVPGNGDTRALAVTLAAFAPGLVGYGLIAYLGRALYARQSWRVAGVAICAGWATVVAADLALVGSFAARWRVVALAVGNSLGMSVAGALLLAGLARAAGPASLAGVGRSAAGSLLGGLIGVGAGFTVSREFGAGSIGPALFVAVVAAAVAMAACAGVMLLAEPAARRPDLVGLLRRDASRAIDG